MVTIVGNLIVDAALTLASLLYNPNPELCEKNSRVDSHRYGRRYHVMCESQMEDGLADCDRDVIQQNARIKKRRALSECDSKYPSPSVSAGLVYCEGSGSDCTEVSVYTPEGEAQAERGRRCFERVGEQFSDVSSVGTESYDQCRAQVFDKAHFCRRVEDLKCDARSASDSLL